MQIRIRVRLPEGGSHELNRTVEASHAEQVYAQLKVQSREYRDGLARPLLRVTLGEYQPAFAKRHPWRHQRKSAWKRLKPLWPLPLRSIDDSAVGRWAYQLGKHVSPGYVRCCWDLLRGILIDARRMKVIAELPCSDRPPGVPSTAKAHQRRRALTDDELSRVLRTAAGELLLRIKLAFISGSRPHAELARARREWLLPSPTWPGAGVLKLPACKGGRPHDVPIPAELYAELVAHVDALPGAARSLGTLFAQRVGGPKSMRFRMRKYLVTGDEWRSLCRRAGVADEVVLYQLKHTRLTAIANDPRLGPRAAQGLAGHSDVRTTQTYMAHGPALSAAAFELPAALQRRDPSPPDDEPDPSPSSEGPAFVHKKPAGPNTRNRARAQRRALKAKVSARVKAVIESEARAEPSRAQAPDMPADDETLLVAAQLVEQEGARAVAERFVGRMGEPGAIGWADDVVRALSAVELAEGERVAVMSLVEEIGAVVRQRIGERMPAEQVSHVESTTWVEGVSCFTRTRRE